MSSCLFAETVAFRTHRAWWRTVIMATGALLAACAAPEDAPSSATGAGAQTASVTAPTPAPTSAPSPAQTAAASATTPATSTSAPTALPTSSAADAGPGGDRDRWVGTWSSSACGSRKYVRIITLAANGSFSAEDRISPCPKGVSCVWSGIVAWKGTWSPSGNAIQLTETGTAAGPKGEPHPTRLQWNGSAPAEGGCAYAR
jgi:hypothetical protein